MIDLSFGKKNKLRSFLNQFGYGYSLDLESYFSSKNRAGLEVQSAFGKNTVIERLKFGDAVKLHDELMCDDTYSMIFSPNLIPIASDKKSKAVDVVCYDVVTGELLLLWLLLWDPFHPIDWQLEKNTLEFSIKDLI